MAVAQNKQVSGTVTDANGAPVIGATVIVDGTNTGTTTGPDGKFTLYAPINGSLQISFIGYEDQLVAIAGKTNLQIQLKEDVTALEDVIVVAFGTAKKEAFTGSASVVKSDDIAKSQVGNVAQSLAGKVAGVQLVNTSGQPGSAPSIHIRGISSISASTQPLYVVDGMPYEGDLANINPSDIESMTVLKDATSNALYGARGANGVVMITTKRGKVGEAVVNLDAKWGVNSRALKEYDVIKDPAQYYETHYNALYNYAYLDQHKSKGDAHLWANENLISGSYGLGYQVYSVPEGQYFIGTNGKVNPAATLGRKVNYKGQDYYLTPDDWIDEAFRNSFRQEYNLSASGSTDRANFYASIGYLNDEGIAHYSDYERYTARLRADYQAKKWLKVGGNMGFTHFDSNYLSDEGESGSSGNVFTYTSRVAPIYPVYIRDGEGNIMIDKNGYKRYDYGSGDNAGLARPVMASGNPLSAAMLDTENSEGNAFNGNAFAEFNIVDGLKVTINGAISLDETRYNGVTNPYYGQYASSNGIVTVQHSRMFSYNVQQLINYNKTFGKHSIEVLLGHEYFNAKTNYVYGSKSNMFSQENTELGGAVTDGSAGSARTEYNTEGFFFRGSYNFDERYYISGSYRRDASSRFHPDNRWGNFWSVGGAWLINKEAFMSGIDWIDMLKLKVSYGSQGNDGIGSYRYTDVYSIRSSAGAVSVLFASKGNKNITWETNANLNAGVDFDFFHGRLGGSIDYFHRKTTDMLFSRPTPLSLGYASYTDNIGDMVNKGIELDIHGTPLQFKNFRWDVNLNLTHMKNKVTKLPPEKNGGFQSGNYWIGEGKPLYTFYMRKYAGVNEHGESTWYQTKADGSKVATTEYASATDYECGAADPDLYGGFGTTFSFFGVDVSVNFTYQLGGQVYDSGYAMYMGSPQSGDTGNNVHVDILKAWTPQNVNSNIPRYQLTDQYSASMSDRFLTDASYLNLQNINVGYTLPEKISRKFLVQKLRIYLSCENVFYWSKRQGLDPRQSFSGSTSAELYSPVRTISGGLNITF